MAESEGVIQKRLIDICELDNRLVWIDRANSGKIKAKGGYVQLHKIGTADLLGMAHDARLIGIEVKTVAEYNSKDHGMSEDQIDFMNMINNAGGVAGPVCSEETLESLLARI